MNHRNHDKSNVQHVVVVATMIGSQEGKGAIARDKLNKNKHKNRY